MKSQTPSPILTAGVIGVLSLFSANTTFAIEPQPDNAKPPTELLDSVDKIDKVQRKLPFIGVVTASLPEMVADHLNIEHGTGVIIRTVMPNSPADRSGIKSNDIILKINESAVNDPETFTAKIRSLKVGDKLKLKTIQKGKPSDLEVTLAERPDDQVAEAPNHEPLLDGIPDGQAQRLRNLIERNLGALDASGFEELLVPDAPIDDRFRMLRERMKRAMEDEPNINPEQAPNFQFQRQSSVRIMDNQGSVEIKSNGDNTEVIVHDLSNKVVWSGPWDTEQDKAAAPDEIRERIEKLNIQKGKDFSLRLGK